MSERELSLTHADFLDLAADVLKSGNLLRFQASGTSMYPFIKDGDTLEFEPFRVQDVRPGDVILFHDKRNRRLVVHRIIQIVTSEGQTRWKTQGDALYHPDGLVDPAHVLGTLTAIVRKGKRLDTSAWSFRIPSLIWNALPFLNRKIYHILAGSKRSVFHSPR